MKALVYLESYDGNLLNSTRQVVQAAFELKEKKGIEEIHGIIIDSNRDGVEASAKTLGLDKIFSYQVQQYNSMTYANYVLQHSSEYELVLFANTTWGQEMSGYVIFKDNRTAITDISGFSDDGNYLRLIHQNDIISKVTADGNLLLTIRTGSFGKAEDGDSDTPVEQLSAEVETGPVALKEISIQEQKRAPLPEADRIVSGGRGIKSPEKYEELIEGLADVIGASTGATRAIVDDGWVDVDKQVGQTGVDVNPSLYFAIGISGAVQHVSGMKSSDVIVAINTDEEAPIFDVADYGIVEDALEFVPALIEALKKRKE